MSLNLLQSFSGPYLIITLYINRANDMSLNLFQLYSGPYLNITLYINKAKDMSLNLLQSLYIFTG